MSDSKTPAAELVEMRKALHLTQKQLGKLLATSTVSVCAWENGKRTVPGPARAYMRLLMGMTAPERALEMSKIIPVPGYPEPGA